MEIIIPLVLTLTLFSHVIFASTLSEDEPDPAQNSTFRGISNYYITTPGVRTHKLHKAQKKTWNDARNTCWEEGGHLVVINSERERLVVSRILACNGVNDEVWMGIHELFSKDDWVSVKDQRIDAIGYIYWRQGKPNNYKNEGEHYLVINKVGMNDQNCNKQFYFVYEM